MDSDPHFTLLFLDKSFLKPRKTNLRGVELFNLSLIKDLAGAGIRVTIPAHGSWQADVDGIPSAETAFYETPWPKALMNGLRVAWHMRRLQYHKIILANVANGLIPALLIMRFFYRPLALLVFAHRLPSARFLAALPEKNTHILAVNGIIAASFRNAGFSHVSVCFGHNNAAEYHPPEPAATVMGAGKKVNFCVVGFLDNAWKGADTALAAFRALPEETSARCVLHLASYRSPPSLPEENIKAYRWFPADEMPEWLRKMDVMIVPSRDEKVMRETFSLAMIEGMLTGLPVLAANLPILAEKLDAGGGYVFNNVNELTQLMVLLVSQPELRTEAGNKARRIAMERYVWNTKDFIRRLV